MFETLDPSSSSSSGVAVVEPNDKLGTVVRKLGSWVALATPTERRRRDGLGTNRATGKISEQGLGKTGEIIQKIFRQINNYR